MGFTEREERKSDYAITSPPVKHILSLSLSLYNGMLNKHLLSSALELIKMTQNSAYK